MLCQYCQPYQDLGTKFIYGKAHHPNLEALVTSANEGCELCQGFLQFMESTTLIHEGKRMSYIEFTKMRDIKPFWVTVGTLGEDFCLYWASDTEPRRFTCVESEIFDEQCSFPLPETSAVILIF